MVRLREDCWQSGESCAAILFLMEDTIPYHKIWTGFPDRQTNLNIWLPFTGEYFVILKRVNSNNIWTGWKETCQFMILGGNELGNDFSYKKRNTGHWTDCNPDGLEYERYLQGS